MLVLKPTKQILQFLFFSGFIFSSTPITNGAPLTKVLLSHELIVARSPETTSIFQPILPQLKAATRIPLLLPTYIPQTDFPLYITVNSATTDGYELTIGALPNCSGGNYCRFGTVSGQKVTSTTPSVEKDYSFMNDPSYRPSERSQESMRWVTLANGVRGYFVPYVCGANCDDSKVIWELKGYRYLVGLKRGHKKAVVQMANSAIANAR